MEAGFGKGALRNKGISCFLGHTCFIKPDEVFPHNQKEGENN